MRRTAPWWPRSGYLNVIAIRSYASILPPTSSWKIRAWDRANPGPDPCTDHDASTIAPGQGSILPLALRKPREGVWHPAIRRRRVDGDECGRGLVVRQRSCAILDRRARVDVFRTPQGTCDFGKIIVRRCPVDLGRQVSCREAAARRPR